MAEQTGNKGITVDLVASKGPLRTPDIGPPGLSLIHSPVQWNIVPNRSVKPCPKQSLAKTPNNNQAGVSATELAK